MTTTVQPEHVSVNVTALPDLPEGIFRPEREKFQEALTEMYNAGFLFRMARDHTKGSPNPTEDAQNLAHMTYTDLYRKPGYDTPLTGTLEENIKAITPWVRRVMKHDADDLARKRQVRQTYVEQETARQAEGIRWRRPTNPFQEYFARETRGGNDAHVLAIVANLRRRWPVSLDVLTRVYIHRESATQLGEDFRGAPRTLREHIAKTKEAIRAYGEWEGKHGGTETNAALVAEVDALERLWVKKRK